MLVVGAAIGFVSFLEKVLNEGVPHLKTVAINFGRMGSAVSGWKEELPPADSAAVFEAPEAITLLVEFIRSAPVSHSLQSLTFNHSRDLRGRYFKALRCCRQCSAVEVWAKRHRWKLHLT